MGKETRESERGQPRPDVGGALRASAGQQPTWRSFTKVTAWREPRSGRGGARGPALLETGQKIHVSITADGVLHSSLPREQRAVPDTIPLSSLRSPVPEIAHHLHSTRTASLTGRLVA